MVVEYVRGQRSAERRSGAAGARRQVLVFIARREASRREQCANVWPAKE